MLKDTLIVTDSETGGLNPKENSLLTLALMVVKNKEVVAQKEWKIKHDTYNVSAGALEVNGIDLVKHGKEATEAEVVGEEIIAFLEEHCSKEEKGMLVGQNTIFDKNFIEAFFVSLKNQELLRAFYRLVSHRYIDLMSITAFLNLSGVLNTDGLSLDAVIEALNLDVKARHTATDDARLTWEALLRLTELMPVTN